MEVTAPRGIHRRTRFEVTQSLKLRFERMVKTGKPNECWPWLGATRNGYGAIKHDKKVLGTHVVALAIAGKFPEEGQVAKHSCDNRICCNPAHLSFGSFSENVREMHDRREVNFASGESSPHSVLTDEIVTWIRAYKTLNGYGNRQLPRLLGLRIESLKTPFVSWKHVPWPAKEDCKSIVDSFDLEAAKAHIAKRYAELDAREANQCR